MTIPPIARKKIEDIATEALDIFKSVSSNAKTKLGSRNKNKINNTHVLANTNLNDITGGRNPFEDINIAQHRNLEDYHILVKEPVVARVTTQDERGCRTTYYISRGAPDSISNSNVKLASYRSQFGSLPSQPIGGEFAIVLPHGGKSVEVYVEIIDKAIFYPIEIDKYWDSKDSVFRGIENKPITVSSLRSLIGNDTITDDILDKILAEEQDSKNFILGIRRNVITKMGLRDQPILDQYQDKIFRLPLDSRLLLLGAPGTGKTTTLIRRLGQKLDREFLETSEKNLVKALDESTELVHEQSWLMFTPTELLRQYVKEAFARENIPASDQYIKTWSDYRRELGRNTFNILRTGNGSGIFILKENADILEQQTQYQQIEWFSDFNKWQLSVFWDGMSESANFLLESGDNKAALLGKKIFSVIQNINSNSLEQITVSLDAIVPEVQGLLAILKVETDKAIRQALNIQLHHNKNFLDELAIFLASLTESDVEQDDVDSDDEDEELQTAKVGRSAAVAAYMSAVRTQARTTAKKKSINKASKTGKIIGWLGERTLDKTQQLEVGNSLLIQSSARQFISPVKRIIFDIPKRYRAFRKMRQSEKLWYKKDGFSSTDIYPLELDVILLAILRNASDLTKDSRILRNMTNPSYAPLMPIYQLYKNQVLVDEATDFSPIQLACMAALAHPKTRSFFACGDFNQRITIWGSRTEDELKWVLPDITIQTIEIYYRQSRKLNSFANKIVQISGGTTATVSLPEYLNNEGVDPVIALSMSDHSKIIHWLKERILEIQKLLNLLPSIAVLVNGEDNVVSIAKGLKEELADNNINVIACRDGRVVGQEQDVRVFDVQHIKGLEFEAVFFIGIDKLAADFPDQFDKFLYVGATRAATYLGVTCEENFLPTKILSLSDSFAENWK